MVNAAVLLPLHKARRGIPAGLLKFTAVLLKFTADLLKFTAVLLNFTAVLLKIHRGSVENQPRFYLKFTAVLLEIHRDSVGNSPRSCWLLGFTAAVLLDFTAALLETKTKTKQQSRALAGGGCRRLF